MRKKLVAANWKLNGSPEFVDSMMFELAKVKCDTVDCAVFPPFVFIPQVKSALPAGWQLGAQNVSLYEQGAFTGEVAADMVVACGGSLALVGHSERRSLFAETDAEVAKKVAVALKSGMDVVLCVGESLAERNSDETMAVIQRQLEAGFSLVSPEDVSRVCVAYEPVWAIGTGVTATPEQAQEVHHNIRALLRVLQPGAESAVRIIYGGSVKAANVSDLFVMPDIDGALVGGASLDAKEFSAICEAAR
ncbi:triosephosphate isomerase [Oleiphilus messinensis]|uniref:Triosephosphate isomerase n=1 Tax=Oleiphilus messinensis TaxID=141451 RepID=A0A1Y0I581_9GAMM|nr:triose-phosphate isomerase [Oleiphilus messinensis]ARU55571.1 triosephosphate isomerase [Oleiphilus messinensis]